MASMTTTQSLEHAIPLDSFVLRLRIARFHAGDLNYKQAAARIGVSDETWRGWEKGRHTEAARKPWMISHIADALGVDEQWLKDGGPLAHPNEGGIICATSRPLHLVWGGTTRFQPPDLPIRALLAKAS